MANVLRTDIQPSQVTIDTIKNFESQTEDTIDEIENVDIKHFEDGIQEYRNFFNTEMRIFRTSVPSTGKKGMACFLRS